jgi:hypothetical protein
MISSRRRATEMRENVIFNGYCGYVPQYVRRVHQYGGLTDTEAATIEPCDKCAQIDHDDESTGEK